MLKSAIFTFICLLPLVASATLGEQKTEGCDKAPSAEFRACYAQAVQAMQKRMDAVYEAARADARKQDATLDAPWNVTEAKLVESQKAFTHYKATYCEESGFVGAQFTTQSSIGEAVDRCEIDMMGQRINLLNIKYHHD